MTVMKKLISANSGLVEDGVAAYNRKDYVTAAKLMRLSADQGYAVAQYNLGVCFIYGRGVTQDYKEAVKWFRLSADQGNADAQFNLGLMYDKGCAFRRSRPVMFALSVRVPLPEIVAD